MLWFAFGQKEVDACFGAGGRSVAILHMRTAGVSAKMIHSNSIIMIQTSLSFLVRPCSLDFVLVLALAA